MTNKDRHREHLARVREFVVLVDEIERVIDREVERAHGHRIRRERTDQEQQNLRQHYTRQIADGNQWLKRATGNRSCHIAMATMYGIAALVDETEVPVVTQPDTDVRWDGRDIW